MQTQRMLVIGDSGSGKTTLMHEHIKRFMAAKNSPRYLVVISRDAPHETPLAKLCTANLEVTRDTPVESMAWRELIMQQKKLYVECGTYQPDVLLKHLGAAIFTLTDVLVVVDEGQHIVTRSAPPEFLDLLLRGRKRNIHSIFIGTSLMQRDQHGFHREVINQATHLVMFAKREPRELKILAAHAPDLADIVPQLARADDGLPEYAIRDKTLNQSHLMQRTGAITLSTSPQSN